VLRGYMNEGGLGQWIDETIKSIEKREDVVSYLIDKIVKAFPSMNDIVEYNGKTVYLYKKAQILVCDLYMLMQDKDERYNFPNIGKTLTIFVDNVIPCVLRKYGILKLCDSLESYINANKEIPGGDQRETELRSVSIAACEEIVKIWEGETNKREDKDKFSMNPMNLDYFLWRKGKEGDWRKLARHISISIFY